MAPARAFACLFACALACPASAPRAPLLVRPRRDANLFALHDWLIDLEEKTELSAAGCKFYAGRLLHEPESTAALTSCGKSYYGAVINAGDLYTLEPTREPRDGHVLKEVPRVYDLSGDTDVSDVSWESDDQKDHDGVAYFTDHKPIISRPWPPRNTSNDVRWLQLAVAADHSVVQFHGRKRARHYLLALIHIVYAIFSDASLGVRLRLALTRLTLEERRRLRRGPARDALASVNRWNRNLLKSMPPDRRHDAAVWLTRAALGGPAGFAPVGGVCSATRGAALARDDGLSAAFVVAHELAHLLGATHDTPACGAGGVMAPTVTATLHHFAWSTCTRNQLQKMLPQWACLSDAPAPHDNLLLTPRQYRFTMNEQCRMEFGDGYELCRSGTAGGEPCGALWCAHAASRDLCKTKKTPPLEGTPCGLNQWCVDGLCESVSPRLAGGAAGAAAAPPAPWGEWGGCQGGCGAGVRTRKRLCEDGSSECGEERATCATAPCEADARAARCRALAATRPTETDYWLPHEPYDEEDRCALYCVRWPSGEVLGPLEPAPEGVRCSYDNEHSVCMKGSCARRPCAAADECGECGGGGRRCAAVELAAAVRARAAWTSGAQLPEGARRVRAAVRPARRTRLALRDRARRLYRLLPAPNIRGGTSSDAVPVAGQLVVGGALLRWILSADTLVLSTEGPLLEDMDLMVGASRTAEDAELMLWIDLNYTLHRNATGGHGWRLVGAPCSASCGGGWRRMKPVCEDERGRPVLAERCAPLPSPHHTTESCNKHSCDWEWWSGPWSHCSATCGGGGVQRRAVQCAPAALSVPAGLEPRGGDEMRCGGDRPHDERPCNRDVCPGEWVLLPWTPCSASCGRGTRQRPATCPAATACGARPPRVARPCRSRCRNCRGDRSAYCALPALRRYCALEPFRRLCCRSCAADG